LRGSHASEDIAKNISGKTWQLVTQEGSGVPEIHVFYRLEGVEVTLEMAAADF